MNVGSLRFLGWSVLGMFAANCLTFDRLLAALSPFDAERCELRSDLDLVIWLIWRWVFCVACFLVDLADFMLDRSGVWGGQLYARAALLIRGDHGLLPDPVLDNPALPISRSSD